MQVVELPLPVTLQRCKSNCVSLLELSTHVSLTDCSVLFLPEPEYCAVAVRLDGAAGGDGGGVVTVSEALKVGSVAPVFEPLVALALTE